MMMDVPADDPRYGLGYALVAYGFFLGVFFAYVAWVHVRTARLRRRVDEAQRRLDARRTSG